MWINVDNTIFISSYAVDDIAKFCWAKSKRGSGARWGDDRQVSKYNLFLNKWTRVSFRIIFYRMLIKNLLLGYLSSTTSDKSAILRVFANVLNFTDSEKDKAGLNNGTGAQSGRFLRSYDKGGSVPLKVYKLIL